MEYGDKGNDNSGDFVLNKKPKQRNKKIKERNKSKKVSKRTSREKFTDLTVNTDNPLSSTKLLSL